MAIVFNKSFYSKILMHLVFCIIMLFFFGFNSCLRPVAYPALYKEYITGFIAIITIYLNYFLLFPKLYICRKYSSYWILTLCSVILSGCLEMLLVFPQLYKIYINYLNRHVMIESFIMNFFHVTFRNGGLVLFAYAVNEIQWLRKQTVEKENIIRTQYSLLDVKNEKHRTLFINTNDIYYCIQERNNSVILLMDGSQFVRYSSMNSLEKLLGEKEFVRISRNVIVPILQIKQWNKKTLTLNKVSGFIEPVSFNISEIYLESVINRLKLRLPSAPTSTIQN